jgi:hypothetical protein
LKKEKKKEKKKIKFRKLLSFPPILFHRWKLSQQHLVVILGNLNFVQTSKTVEFSPTPVDTIQTMASSCEGIFSHTQC